MLPPPEVATLRSIKRSAIVLLLLIRLDRPVTAKHLSEILAIDYQTTRKYLHELNQVGAALHMPTGWIFSQGSQLLLPMNSNAKKSRSESPESESESNRKKASHLPDSSLDSDLKREILALGVFESIADDFISTLDPDHLCRHISQYKYRLETGQARGPGYFVLQVRQDLPPPPGWKPINKYTEGRYSDFINN